MKACPARQPLEWSHRWCTDGAQWSLLVVVYVGLLMACTSAPSASQFEHSTPVVLVPAQEAGVRDLRGDFRAAVCKRLTSDDPSCEAVLHRLAGEPREISRSHVDDLPVRYRVAFVPGLFADCVADIVRPFADGERALREAGFTVDYLEVSGRGTVAENAVRLADYFFRASEDRRGIIVFAYSKGLPDLLEFVVRFPTASQRIAAIVSVAGAVNGSPLADEWHVLYRRWVAGFPLPHCARGSGEEVSDLRQDVRLEWWRRHGDEVSVPIFTLVAAPRPERVSPAARALYRRLSQVDPRNDGRLMWHDQIAPKSYLLGYVNADHWTIALPMEEKLSGFSWFFRDEVPRVPLVKGAIEVVAQTLAEYSTK